MGGTQVGFNQSKQSLNVYAPSSSQQNMNSSSLSQLQAQTNLPVVRLQTAITTNQKPQNYIQAPSANGGQ
jgi:hypothetical protein